MFNPAPIHTGIGNCGGILVAALMESPAAQVGSPGSQYLSNPDAACSPTFKDWPLAQISEYFRLYSWEKFTLNFNIFNKIELCVEVNLPVLHGFKFNGCLVTR